jgi:hypothetical protein
MARRRWTPSPLYVILQPTHCCLRGAVNSASRCRSAALPPCLPIRVVVTLLVSRAQELLKNVVRKTNVDVCSVRPFGYRTLLTGGVTDANVDYTHAVSVPAATAAKLVFPHSLPAGVVLEVATVTGKKLISRSTLTSPDVPVEVSRGQVKYTIVEVRLSSSVVCTPWCW